MTLSALLRTAGIAPLPFPQSRLSLEFSACFIGMTTRKMNHYPEWGWDGYVPCQGKIYTMTESCAALSKVSDIVGDDARLNNNKNIKINSVAYHARMKLVINSQRSYGNSRYRD